MKTNKLLITISAAVALLLVLAIVFAMPDAHRGGNGLTGLMLSAGVLGFGMAASKRKWKINPNRAVVLRDDEKRVTYRAGHEDQLEEALSDLDKEESEATLERLEATKAIQPVDDGSGPDVKSMPDVRRTNPFAGSASIADAKKEDDDKKSSKKS